MYIANRSLAFAYSSAGVVLNDRWHDMREWGFISNRIFDVLASGGNVVSDAIDGMDSSISGINIYSQSDELVAAIDEQRL